MAVLSDGEVASANLSQLWAWTLARLGYITMGTGDGWWLIAQPTKWHKFIEYILWPCPPGPYQHPVYAGTAHSIPTLSDLADEALTTASVFARADEESDESCLRRAMQVFRLENPSE